MAFYNRNAVSKYDAIFDGASKANGLRYDFLRNIGQIESGYRADAQPKDKTGKLLSSAKGVMQLINGTGREMGLANDADFFDPNKNINAGAKYLARMLKASKGDEMRAALAYHSGLGSQDIKNYDAGNYSAITDEGRGYLQKVTGTAQGGQHAQDHFGTEAPKPEVLSDVIPTSTNKAASPQLNSIIQGANVADNQGLVPSAENYDIPQADTSRDVQYATEHGGQNQAQVDYNQDSSNPFKNTGAAIENGLGNSVVGTFGRAWQQNDFHTAMNTLRPSFMGPTYDDAYYQKLESSNLDPNYYSMMDGIKPQDFDRQLTVAQENQRRDEELAAKGPGMAASLIGGMASMAGDPAFLLTLPFGGEGAMSQWANGLKSGGMRFAARTGLRIGQNATIGVASDALKSHISGGDKNPAHAAVAAVMLGELMHGAGVGVKAIRGRVEARRATPVDTTVATEGENLHPQNVNTSTVDQTITEQPAPHVSEYHEETHVNLADNITSHGRRIEMQESARNLGESDPTLARLSGQERLHNYDGHDYVVQDSHAVDPVSGERNPLSGEAHDVFNANGQRIDAASPLNPHTRWQSEQLDSMSAPSTPPNPNSSEAMIATRAASAPFSGLLRGMEDIGLSANKLEHSVLSKLMPELMSSPTGIVKTVKNADGTVSEAWVGSRQGAHTGDEVLKDLHAQDEISLRNMHDAAKDVYKSPRYSSMDREEANQVFGRRIAEAIEDATGQKWEGLSTPEKDFAQEWRNLMNDKHFQMTNPQRWGVAEATSLLGENVVPDNYFMVEWDARHINEFVFNMFGGDKDAATKAVKDSFIKDYADSPATQKRVNEQMEREYDGSVERQKRETAAKHARDAQAKVGRKIDANKVNDALALNKADNTADLLNQALTEQNLHTPEGLQARFEEHYAKFSEKADTARKLANAQKKAQQYLDKDLKDIERAVKSKANEHYQNAQRRARHWDEKLAEAAEVTRKAEEAAKAPLDPMQLKLMVEKHAGDVAYGIIHQGEAVSADAHAAILRAQNSNSLAGAGNSPMLKGRSGFGYGTTIELPNGMEFSPNDLRNFDTEEMLPAYLKQANGNVAVMASTGKHVNEVVEAINKARKDAKDLKVTDPAKAKEQLKEVSVAENVLKLLLQRSRRKQDEGAGDPKIISAIGRSIGDVSFGTHNSSFWINNLGEPAAMVGKVGVATIRNSMHAIRDLTNPNLKMTKDNVLSMRNAMMGFEVHNVIVPRNRTLIKRWQDEGYGPTQARLLGGMQKVSGTIAQANPFTWALQKSTAKIIELAERHAITEIIQDAHNIGHEAVYLRDNHLNSAGLTPEQGASLKQMILDHTENRDGHIVVKDLQKLQRDERAPLFTRLVRNASEEAIQKENLNQMTTRPISWWGSLMLQFSRFAMKSYARSFKWHHNAWSNGRALDAAMYTILGGAMTTGAYALRVWISSLNMAEGRKKDYLKTSLSPKMLAFNAFARNPIMGGFTAPISVALSKVGVDPAKNIRSSIVPPATKPRPMDWSNPYAVSQKAGQLLAQATPAGSQIFGGIATAGSAIKLGMAGTTKERRDALNDFSDASRTFIPSDPLSLGIHRFIMKHSGADVDAKKR